MPPVSIAYTLAPGATAPTRATPGAAGLDLHAHLPDGARVSIPPGEWAHIPTGVSVALPPGYEGQVRPRSGLAWKHGLTVLNSPGTIDADYRGEVAVILVNHGNDDFAVEHGDRIAQLVIAHAADAVLVAAETDLPPTKRGAGGFGSTGTGPVEGPDDRYRKGYRAGYDDGYEDGCVCRTILEARVRRLEAEVLEARAEAAQWARELDALRAGGSDV